VSSFPDNPYTQLIMCVWSCYSCANTATSVYNYEFEPGSRDLSITVMFLRFLSYFKSIYGIGLVKFHLINPNFLFSAIFYSTKSQADPFATIKCSQFGFITSINYAGFKPSY